MKRITGIVCILIAMGLVVTQAHAMEHGSFSLQPGAVQEVRTGSTYRLLRTKSGPPERYSLQSVTMSLRRLHLVFASKTVAT